MLFQVREAQGEAYRAGTWVGPQGEVVALQGAQIQLQALAWARQKNGRQVPTQWRVQVPGHGVDVQVEAVESQAWMATRFPYWEGPVRLTGSAGGRGYLEMTGY
ncbi:Hydroxyneurosporene synthase (CrtC) [compost metagenome]